MKGAGLTVKWSRNCCNSSRISIQWQRGEIQLMGGEWGGGTNQFVGENEQKKKKELSTEKQIVQWNELINTVEEVRKMNWTIHITF